MKTPTPLTQIFGSHFAIWHILCAGTSRHCADRKCEQFGWLCNALLQSLIILYCILLLYLYLHYAVQQGWMCRSLAALSRPITAGPSHCHHPTLPPPSLSSSSPLDALLQQANLTHCCRAQPAFTFDRTTLHAVAKFAKSSHNYVAFANISCAATRKENSNQL